MRRRQGIITAGMLGILVLLLILCPGVAESYAVSMSEARSSDTSSVSISLSPSLDLEVLPSGSGTTSRESVELNITTANTSGFHVLVNSSKTTDLVNNHHDEVISTISSPTALSSLPLNTWGIYLGATSPNSSSTFSPLSTTPTELVHNELANASGTYKLAIGAKVDTSLPAGLYSNELVISVIVTPPEITSLADATYMQDITPEICANSKIWESEADSATLIDKRDGKSYKVARLKDGNCWMQEDLKLTLSTDIPLTSEDSDITPNEDGSVKSWVASYNTNATSTAPSDANNTESWHIDNYWYYSWVAATAGSGQTMVIAEDPAPDSICPRGWQLPSDGRNVTTDTNGSFKKLFAIYGLSLSSDESLLKIPLEFTRGGNIWQGNNYVGSYGFYWSRNYLSGIDAYAIYFYSGGIGFNYDMKRAAGCTIRCVTVNTEDAFTLHV